MALCLLFLLWFITGVVMIYVPYPSLSDDARLRASEPVNLAMVRTSPAQALRRGGLGSELRLVSAAGRARYLVKPADGPIRAIDAYSGQPLPLISASDAGKIAARFARSPVAEVSAPVMYDQWVVHDHFDRARPFYRVSLGDAAGTELYVSARTGEVMQRTRAAERAWNWIGSVIHWIYFTSLRRSFSAWDQTVWWVSLFGLATTVVGVVLGVYRTQKRMTARRPDWSPFHGWLRWHHGLGLGAAIFVFSWILSGWLSMDHGRLFSRGEPSALAEARYHGAPLVTALGPVTPSEFADLGPASQLTFAVVGGVPLVAAEGTGEARVRLLDQPGRASLSALPAGLLAGAASKAWPLASMEPKGPGEDDQLYRAAEGMSDRVVRYSLAQPAGAGIYIDPISGSLVVLMDASRKAYAWIYFALHTFKFPFLLGRTVLRNVLEIIPMLAGIGFSVTGLVIAIKRLRIKFM